jgi:glycine cleavage system H protein
MSAATDVKTDRKYTKEHEWALNRASEVLVGISAFAVDQLGDITLVNLDVKPGDSVQAHKTFGTIESVKTLSDLYSPVSGKVVRINAELENKPELINEDPWEKGWMIAIVPSDLDKESQGLLEPSAYSALLESAGH